MTLLSLADSDVSKALILCQIREVGLLILVCIVKGDVEKVMI